MSVYRVIGTARDAQTSSFANLDRLGIRSQLTVVSMAINDFRSVLQVLSRHEARIRVFDPACGSGNFLVIAYKQMREIEAEINKRRGEPNRSSEIPLTNFRGIELRDFPAEIARLVEAGATGVIAGCTEIELLVAPEDVPVEYFATTRLHALAAVEWSLS